MFIVIWRFHPVSDQAQEFERIYGPSGRWVDLFRRGKGFAETRLLKSSDGWYLTVDQWRDESSYQGFLRDFAAEYAVLDRECSALVEAEELIGRFQSLGE